MNSNLSGHVFQVTSNIQSGMIHNDKPTKKPEESATYQSKEFIGKVAAADFVRIKPTCESVPHPESNSKDLGDYIQMSPFAAVRSGHKKL